MPIKQLFAVLSVFVFGISFASQAAVAWPTNNAPRERTYVKDSVRKNLGQKNASLAAKYRTTMLDRFMKYTTYDSQSSDAADITPEQIETAKKLYAEIKNSVLKLPYPNITIFMWKFLPM